MYKYVISLPINVEKASHVPNWQKPFSLKHDDYLAWFEQMYIGDKPDETCCDKNEYSRKTLTQ